MRRLALLLGVVGAILGGFSSYLELQPVLRQRANHKRFEQLTNSPLIQQARTSCFGSVAQSEHGPWEDYQPQQKNLPPLPIGAKLVPPYCIGAISDPNEGDYTPSESNSSGIKTVHFQNREIQSIDTQDGQTFYPTPAPAWWMFLLIAIFPVVGFFIPWGVVRSIVWVGAGFAQSGK